MSCKYRVVLITEMTYKYVMDPINMEILGPANVTKEGAPQLETEKTA